MAANNGIDRTGRLTADERSPFDDERDETTGQKSPVPGEANRSGPATDVASRKTDDPMPVARAGGPGVADPQPRLPTKEESERQFREEAAQNAVQIREQYERKTAELQSARYQERVKFHEELRTIVQQPTSDAAVEINQLVKRYSFDGDPARRMEAERIWHFSRSINQQAAKVRMVRQLDLPESVILDFLSDDFHAQVRTRNGPRNENEVRVRAAQRLLSIGLPPADAMPAPRQPMSAGPGRTTRFNALPSADKPVQRRR